MCIRTFTSRIELQYYSLVFVIVSVWASTMMHKTAKQRREEKKTNNHLIGGFPTDLDVNQNWRVRVIAQPLPHTCTAAPIIIMNDGERCWLLMFRDNGCVYISFTWTTHNANIYRDTWKTMHNPIHTTLINANRDQTSVASWNNKRATLYIWCVW